MSPATSASAVPGRCPESRHDAHPAVPARIDVVDRRPGRRSRRRRSTPARRLALPPGPCAHRPGRARIPPGHPARTTRARGDVLHLLPVHLPSGHRQHARRRTGPGRRGTHRPAHPPGQPRSRPRRPGGPRGGGQAAPAGPRPLDPARWTLARTEAHAVRQLAAVLGVRYRALADGGFNHTSELVLLDRDGRPLARTPAAGPVPAEDFLLAVRAALGPVPPPPAD